MTELVREYGPDGWQTGEPSGGGGGGVLVDLGTVLITDLINGEQVLRTPAEPEWTQLTWDAATVVATDAQGIYVIQQSGDPGSDPLWHVNLTAQATPGTNGSPNPRISAAASAVSSDPIRVGLVTADGSGYYVEDPLVAWQANHAYGFKTCITEADSIWSSDAGTSAGSEPNWASAPNTGDTVSDNTLTWTNEGPLPTQGTIHLYGLVSTP